MRESRDSMKVKNGFILRKVGKQFVVAATGEASKNFNGMIRQGIDSVALRTLDRPPRKFDILFYRRSDGSYILHRVKKVTKDGLVLWGDNHTMLEYGVRDDMIIGYAARIFRGETELDCQSLRYKLYLWLWQFKAIRNLVLPFAYHLRKEKNT